MATLSLAMIVKNEEHNLAQCLRSVAAFVNEIVIVDTGSTDKTREVAVSFGANVYQYDDKNHPESFFVDDEKTNAAFGGPGAYSGLITLGDFAAARNESFARTTGDYVLWVDADDVVEGAAHLPGFADDLAARGLDFGFLAYDYARDHLGRVFYRQWRERIVKRGSGAWVNPVHEVILPTRVATPVRYDQTWISHHRKADRPGTPHRNYKLLLRHVHQQRQRGEKVDPRSLFYLGQEARFVEPQRALVFYEDYLRQSGWAEERAAAHVALGSLYEFGMVGLPMDESLARANREFSTAAVEMPSNPDGLFGLARIAYLRERWQDCVSYTERGLSIGNTDSMLGANPLDRTYRPHFYYNHALSKLGRIEEALTSCKAALAVCPDDPGIPGGASGMLSLNARVYEDELRRRQASSSPPPTEDQPMVTFDKNEPLDAPPAENIPRDALVIWAMQLWKQVMLLGDATKARALLDSLPPMIAADPVVGRMKEATDRRFAKTPSEVSLELRDNAEHVRKTYTRPALASAFADQVAPRPAGLSVVIWTGPAFEPWDPTTPNTKGIGGSETAAIEMGKNLAALGHRVTVYGDCAATAGIYDGVTYIHYADFRPCECDVLIASRSPAIGEHVKAKLKLLWVHDIHVGAPSATLERCLLDFDRILCLSQFHKTYFLSVYPTVHADRVIVTRNGIDPARFSNIVAKSNRLVWSSSPNRGLDMLLQNFKIIRANVPDAELHICYGFDCWETFARARNDARELADIQRYKDLIADGERRGGVKWHGRIGQQQLADLFMSAKVWPYLSEFPETSCISAMEAQAAGCVPVASRQAGAVGETVKHGILIDNSPTCGEEFVNMCIAMLTNEPERSKLAQAGREYALAHLSWKALAEEWSAMFRKLMVQVAVQPMAQWASR